MPNRTEPDPAELCRTCRKPQSEHYTLTELVTKRPDVNGHIFIGRHNASMFGLRP